MNWLPLRSLLVVACLAGSCSAPAQSGLELLTPEEQARLVEQRENSEAFQENLKELDFRLLFAGDIAADIESSSRFVQLCIASIKAAESSRSSWIGRPDPEQFREDLQFARIDKLVTAESIADSESYAKPLEDGLRQIIDSPLFREPEHQLFTRYELQKLVETASQMRWQQVFGLAATEAKMTALEFAREYQRLDYAAEVKRRDPSGETDPERLREVIETEFSLREGALAEELFAQLRAIARQLHEARRELYADLEQWGQSNDPAIRLYKNRHLLRVFQATFEFSTSTLDTIDFPSRYTSIDQSALHGLDGSIHLPDADEETNDALIRVTAMSVVVPPLQLDLDYRALPDPNAPVSITSSKPRYAAGEDISLSYTGGMARFQNTSEAEWSELIVVPTGTPDVISEWPKELQEDYARMNADEFNVDLYDNNGKLLWMKAGRVRVWWAVDFSRYPAIQQFEWILDGLVEGNYEARFVVSRNVDDPAFRDQPNVAAFEVQARHQFTVGPAAATPRQAYPQYIYNIAATVPTIESWGNGIPGAATNDWSNLIPEDVITANKLNGRWIVMAIYGKRLFDFEGENPAITWAPADKHLQYKLLHAGAFTSKKVAGFEDEPWNKFWKALNDRVDPMTSLRKHNVPLTGTDVYVVGVRLSANTWAGAYEFRLGDLRIKWTLSNATNVGSTQFTRLVTDEYPEGDAEYEPILNVFKHDTFYVEIRTAYNVSTTDRIAFELIKSTAGGAGSPVKYGNVTTVFAHRTSIDPNLFRSPKFNVNIAGGNNGWRMRNGRREYTVAMTKGDRLAARIVPHGPVRQGAMGVASVYTVPAEVDSFWREAVMTAAKIANAEPTKRWDALTKEEFNRVLVSNWKTVDSTPFVRAGGRKIQLKVGDLAAMLLVRQKFISTMKTALPPLKEWKSQLEANPGFARSLFLMMREDALAKSSPIGEIQVPMWDPQIPQLAFDALYKTPFKNAYDEEWLSEKFKGPYANRFQWQAKVAAYAFNEYLKAAEESLKHAETIDTKDAEKMLKLTTLGMKNMSGAIRPNLLKLVEDPASIQRGGTGFRWEIDRVARGYVGTINKLGAEFIANEALVDQYNALTALAAAGVGFALPEALAARVAATLISATSMTATLTHELPEYIRRKNDVKFAMGAYAAIGSERYVSAKLRQKPGWQMGLELIGGSLDLVANVAQLVHVGRGWYTMLPDVQVAEVLGKDPRVFAQLPRDDQMAAFSRLAQLSRAQDTGQALNQVEANIVSRGMRMLEQMETVKETLPPRYLHPAVVGQAESLTFRGQHVEYVTFREFREVTRSTDAGGVVGTGTHASHSSFNTMELTLREARGTFALSPNEPWHTFKVGDHLGQGVSSEVYALREADRSEDVLKVLRDLKYGHEDLARQLHCAKLIDGVVPQLKIKSSGNIGRAQFLVQERIPQNGYMLRRAVGKIAGDTLPVDLAEQAKYQRTIGVFGENGEFRLMTREETVAVCTMYKNLMDKGIVWFDGHFGNFVLVKENNGLVAKVLDQDFFWKWDENYLRGPVGSTQSNVLHDLYDGNHAYFRVRMQSMEGKNVSAAQMLRYMDGKHLYPDAEFFTYKMLERWGFINYVRGKGWTDGAMKFKDVKDFFKNVDDARFVDPDFTQLRPRRSSIDPVRLRDRRMLPLRFIMPEIEVRVRTGWSERIAA